MSAQVALSACVRAGACRYEQYGFRFAKEALPQLEEEMDADHMVVETHVFKRLLLAEIDRRAR